jgi:hypothetical protein
MTLGEHCLSRLDHGHVHRKAIGDGLVEGLAEYQGGRIGDLELHRDHRGDALPHQCLCNASQRVIAGTAGALAGIQDDQPQ